MKELIFALFIVLCPQLGYGLDVHLAWDANTETDLDHYRLYQATCYEDKTGPWLILIDIAKTETTVTVQVEDGKNFSWYLSASDTSGNESRASNTVTLYDKVPPLAPANLTKE